MSKLVSSVLLCPYSAAMANDVYVRRPKAASLCGVHSYLPEAETWWEKMLRKQPLHLSISTTELCQAWGCNRVLAWPDSFRGSTVPTHHPARDLSPCPLLVLPPLLVQPQLQAGTAHGAKVP